MLQRNMHVITEVYADEEKYPNNSNLFVYDRNDGRVFRQQTAGICIKG